MPLPLFFPPFIPLTSLNQPSGVKVSMLLTSIHVWNHCNSVSKRLNMVSFKGTNYKVDTDGDILSVKQPLENSYIPVAIWLVPATQMMWNMKYPISSKKTNRRINPKVSLSLEFSQEYTASSTELSARKNSSKPYILLASTYSSIASTIFLISLLLLIF